VATGAPYWSRAVAVAVVACPTSIELAPSARRTVVSTGAGGTRGDATLAESQAAATASVASSRGAIADVIDPRNTAGGASSRAT
jgi:hypothetical protein